MGQITNPTYPVVGGSVDAWGQLLNQLLQQIVAQGNSSDSVLASLAETIRDTVAAALVQGAGVVITVDDPNNRITIASTGVEAADVDGIVAALINNPTSATRAALDALITGGTSGTYYLLTETGAYLTTETGAHLVTQ